MNDGVGVCPANINVIRALPHAELYVSYNSDCILAPRALVTHRSKRFAIYILSQLKHSRLVLSVFVFLVLVLELDRLYHGRSIHQ